jgi:flagellin-like hook-associated protein FlgL
MALVKRKSKDLSKLQVELKKLRQSINELLETGRVNGQAGLWSGSISPAFADSVPAHEFIVWGKQRELFTAFDVL